MNDPRGVLVAAPTSAKNVYIVWYDSRLLGTVFHGVYASKKLAEEESERMENERPGIDYWAEFMDMNSNVEE